MAVMSQSPPRPTAGGHALRVVFIALGFAFLAITGYLVVLQAVTPGGGRAPRLDIDALGRLSPTELAEAQASAQAGFARNPLDAASLSQLARIAEVRDDREAAARLKLIAGDMQPRALGIQAEALGVLLERRDFARAMTALDGLVRARPNQSPELFEVAAEIATDPDGRNAVTAKLAEQPPWRRQFLARTIAGGTPELIEQILSDLRSLGSPVDTPEYALLIGHYLKSGEIDAAHEAWFASLDEEERKRVKLIYDGGFDQRIRNLRFDWTIQPTKGLSYQLFPRNTASMDATLQIDLRGFEGDFANLSQLLRLRPGRYRLSGEVRFEGFDSPSGMAFRLHCLNMGKLNALEETGPLPQSGQWIPFEKTFSVPLSDCPDQLLRLESRGGGDATSLTGQVAFDNIAIETLAPLEINAN